MSKAFSLSPADLATLYRQVVDRFSQARYAEVETLLLPLLNAGSGPLVLWHMLARTLIAQSKMMQAQPIMEMLVQMRPGDMTLRFDMAQFLLQQGDFTRGWREYRFRYQMQHTALFGRHVQTPRWQGQRLEGKSLLIYDEQGFGDTFQFLRLVRAAREKSGAFIILEVNQESAALARTCSGWDTLIVRGRLPPPFDYHCELMNLPMALGLQLTDLPGEMPYLFADAQRIAHWQQRLAQVPSPRVGLVWAGRAEHANDVNRSMTLNDLAPLAQAGVSLLALQKGPASAQAATPPAGMNLLDLGNEITCFDDTAAILCVIDILISVDSSPVHLAGALGRPVWVMLPYAAEWRWLSKRRDSPWYPTATLFRQPQPKSWAPVVRAIGEKLAQLSAPRC